MKRRAVAYAVFLALFLDLALYVYVSGVQVLTTGTTMVINSRAHSWSILMVKRWPPFIEVMYRCPQHLVWVHSWDGYGSFSIPMDTCFWTSR